MKYHLIAAAAAFVACGAAGAKDIRIAHVYDKTGPLEAYAKQTQIGLMMGLEYATSGTMMVNGRKIVVIEKDNQGKPDVAKSLLAEAYARRQGRHRGRPDLVPARRWRCCRWPRRTRRSCSSSRRWPTPSPARSGTATSSAPARNSSQDAISNAVALGKQGVTIATLAQDYAFGRDGVAAFKEALARTGASWRTRNTLPRHDHRLHRRRAAPVRRAEGQAGPQDHLHHLGRRQPVTKIADLQPEALRHRDRHRRQHPAGA